MPMIDLHFPVLGSAVPTDHGYELYAALARAVPELHRPDWPVFVGPLTGKYAGNGQMRLGPGRSRLRLRLPVEKIATVLPLAGKALKLGGQAIRVGVPEVHSLVPAPALIARLVTIKGFTEPGPFVEAAGRQLAALGIEAQPGIPWARNGQPEGKVRRHVLRIKGTRLVGFTVQVVGLTAEETVKLQEHGLGGRHRMGCGFFVPLRHLERTNE